MTLSLHQADGVSRPILQSIPDGYRAFTPEEADNIQVWDRLLLWDGSDFHKATVRAYRPANGDFRVTISRTKHETFLDIDDPDFKHVDDDSPRKPPMSTDGMFVAVVSKVVGAEDLTPLLGAAVNDVQTKRIKRLEDRVAELERIVRAAS